VVEGWARFEEGHRRRYLEPGDLVRSDMASAGTEAFAGATSHYLVVEWDPDAHGAHFERPFEIERIDRRDLARVTHAASRMRGPVPELGVIEVLDVLRAAGLRFDALDAPTLLVDDDPELQRLQSVVSSSLCRLDAFPDVEDLACALGWQSRRIHRRMSELRDRYRTPWTHWRAVLHHIRFIHALRLLSARGATTEKVARLSGFRAPNALYHAFADAGLPSPGRIAHAARTETLARWAELVPLDVKSSAKCVAAP
jgi:hypothetical protein